MPTRLKKKGGQWQARVFANGRQVASKLFPPGRKNGPEWRAAKEWEEEVKAAVLAGVKASSDSANFVQWLKLYLDHAWRTMSEKTAKEKAAVLDDFADYCLERDITTPDQISPQVAHMFLTSIHDQRGGHAANKYRKNLLAAWNWGADMVENFPDRLSPFLKVKPFRVEHSDRYVPPDEDVAAVLAKVTGQDAVMLLAYIQTGARRGELFRLTWSDVDLDNNRLRLVDHKGANKAARPRWQSINDDLVGALRWWREARPLDVPNVFMQLAHYETKNPKTGAAVAVSPGDPFTLRRHFMKTICEKAGVKPFGFHALRHKAAEIVYLAGGKSNDAQTLLGHAQASTTNRYLKSAGLYADKSQVVNAIMENSVGQAAAEQVRKAIAPEVAASEAICKQSL